MNACPCVIEKTSLVCCQQLFVLERIKCLTSACRVLRLSKVNPMQPLLHLKGILKIHADLDWTVRDGIWYCLCLTGLWFIIGHLQLSLLIMGGGTEALTTVGCLIIFLILLKISWKVSTRIRMTPVKSFLNQTIKNPNAPYRSIIGMRFIRFRRKILAASDTESEYAIRCTWVLSLHLYRWEQCMYNWSPERDQYTRAC